MVSVCRFCRPPSPLLLVLSLSRWILDSVMHLNLDAFAKKHQGRWLSKKRQMQGARLSSNEAYLRTSKQ
jgi:hypothetical protein